MGNMVKQINDCLKAKKQHYIANRKRIYKNVVNIGECVNNPAETRATNFKMQDGCMKISG